MVVLDFFDGFFYHNLQCNLYTEFVSEFFEKTDLFKAQSKDLLQHLAEKIGPSVYGCDIRKDIDEEY